MIRIAVRTAGISLIKMGCRLQDIADWGERHCSLSLSVERVRCFAEQPRLVLCGKKIHFFFDYAKTDGFSALRVFRLARTAQHAFGAECLVDGFYVGVNIQVWPRCFRNSVDSRRFAIEIGVFGGS